MARVRGETVLFMIVILFVPCLLLAALGPVLGVQGTELTLDGKPVFLLGASYYGALGIQDPAFIDHDLDDLAARGMNWIRVWATWNYGENDVSAVGPDGAPREPYMGRLLELCRKAGQRGMVVDVTVTRGKAPVFASTLAEHRAVMSALAERLKPFRNVYFDVGNERNIGDARHVPMRDVGELIALVKSIDPERLCTASQGGDIPEKELADYLDVGKVDFLCPHRPRAADTPAETAACTGAYLKMMNQAGRIVPVHYQEPFRRDYGDWNPRAADFAADLAAAREGGAAGWCFHNGAARKSEDGRPRRSFDMRPPEGRLFDQLDAEERAFLEQLPVRK